MTVALDRVQAFCCGKYKNLQIVIFFHKKKCHFRCYMLGIGVFAKILSERFLVAFNEVL